MDKNIYLNKKHFLWIVPLVGILIGFLYLLHPQIHLGKKTALHFIHGILATAGIWAGCFGIVTYLWKKYPWEHYPVKHLVYEVIAILAYTLLFGFIIVYTEHHFGFTNDLPGDIYLSILLTIFITFFITGVHEAVYFYKQWKYHFSKSVRLEKDNIEANYEMLKNQINPHFLFNSLNSLTYLVENNSRAIDYIQNMSNILRYSLKSRDTELVPLKDELEIVEKYIEIQSLRFKSNLNISIQMIEGFNQYFLPPLTLQMLLENCVKHNIISRDKPLSITIYQEDSYLVVENNLQKKHQPNSTGQGLNNLTERYRYLSGREVKIIETSDTFVVKIPLLRLTS
ncbi:MAG: sensor histidine kinase [Bacteroidota bacterium]